MTAGTSALVLALFAVPLVLLLRETAAEEARESAHEVARGVAEHVSAADPEAAALTRYVQRVNGRDREFPVMVALPDGSTLGVALPERDKPSSADLPHAGGGHDALGVTGDSSDAQLGEALRPVLPALTYPVNGGEIIAVTVETSGGPVEVAAFSARAAVNRTVLGWLGPLGGAAAALLVGAVAVADFVARRLAHQLEAAARTADELRNGDMSARAPDTGPREVRRVGLALNRLADRINELLTAERETVTDLSHRLRTPLMAVRLDVEALPLTPQKAELEQDVADLERMLSAVIHAARRPQREGAEPYCDPTAVARDRFNFWAPLAEDQGRETSLTIEEGLPEVRATAADLSAALDALLENAIAHTPEGTSIAVQVSAGDSTVLLDVRDQGPGIPASAIHRGRSDRGSTGLGLDIARSCAKAAGGRLELHRTHDWASVRLVLGAR